VKYFSIYPNAGYTFPDQINTFLMKCDVFGCGENYKIDLNDFEYNEEYKAYYFDVESSFDHIVTFQGYYQMDIFRWSKNYYRTDYRDEQVGDWVYRAFITNGTEINYNDISYTFTNSDSKYLDAMVNYDGIRYELIITETNR